MQKTPLETLGFKTSSFADKSCHLNPAKAGNWRISINAAAALGDGRDLLFYRGDVPPAGNFLPIAAESHPAETKKNYYWEQWASGDTFLIEKGAISGKLSAGDKSGPGRYAAGRGNGRETISQKMEKCPGHKNRW
jgi:hypothetical protein